MVHGGVHGDTSQQPAQPSPMLCCAAGRHSCNTHHHQPQASLCSNSIPNISSSAGHPTFLLPAPYPPTTAHNRQLLGFSCPSSTPTYPLNCNPWSTHQPHTHSFEHPDLGHLHDQTIQPAPEPIFSTSLFTPFLLTHPGSKPETHHSSLPLLCSARRHRYCNLHALRLLLIGQAASSFKQAWLCLMAPDLK